MNEQINAKLETEELSPEALEEAEHLQALEYDYVEEELCPCIYVQYCEGVPLNPHPEVVREQEAEFHAEMEARKDELLGHQKNSPT